MIYNSLLLLYTQHITSGEQGAINEQLIYTRYIYKRCWLLRSGSVSPVHQQANNSYRRSPSPPPPDRDWGAVLSSKLTEQPPGPRVNSLMWNQQYEKIYYSLINQLNNWLTLSPVRRDRRPAVRCTCCPSTQQRKARVWTGVCARLFRCAWYIK